MSLSNKQIQVLAAKDQILKFFKFQVLNFSRETWDRLVEENLSRFTPEDYPRMYAAYRKNKS